MRRSYSSIVLLGFVASVIPASTLADSSMMMSAHTPGIYTVPSANIPTRAAPAKKSANKKSVAKKPTPQPIRNLAIAPAAAAPAEPAHALLPAPVRVAVTAPEISAPAPMSPPTKPIPFSAPASVNVPVKPAEASTPAPVHVPAKAAETDSPAKELNMADLNKLTIKIVHKGVNEDNTNPNTSVYLTGSLFRDCADKFRFENFKKPVIGFKVIDRGGGMSCQESKKAEKSCTRGDCLFLSSVDGTRIDLADAPDGKIVLISTDTGKDPGPDGTDNISTDEFDVPAHVSKATLKARELALARAERAAKIEQLSQLVSSCRKTSDDLVIARRAAIALFDLDKDRTKFSQVLVDLERADLDLMIKKAEKGSLDDLEQTRQDLVAWADSHSDDSRSAERIAKALRALAGRTVTKKGVAPDDYIVARDLLTDAKSLSALSEASAASLEKDLEANELGFLAAAGMKGDMFTFQGAYREAAGKLIERINQSCYGMEINMESCYAAVAAKQKLDEIPAKIQMVEAQKQQMAMEQRQKLAQMLSGGQQSPNGGMQNASSPMGAFNPTGMASLSGMPNQSGMQSPQFNMYGMGGSSSMGMGMNMGSGMYGMNGYGTGRTF